MDPETAARTIFAPRHTEEDSHAFVSMAGDGTVAGNVEIWDRRNNTLQVRRRETLMVTCSNGVVPSARSINGICAVCGGPDELVSRCAVCGVVLCQLHAKVLDGSSGAKVYCPEHLAEALDKWDTWAALDGGYSRGTVGPWALTVRRQTPKDQQ